MSANDYQHGGEHYATEYQHWDFVSDLELHYLIGCASKYLTRWRDKNGVEDLRKAHHYLEKAIERGVPGKYPAPADLLRFTSQLPETEGLAVYAMVTGNLYGARAAVAELIVNAP